MSNNRPDPKSPPDTPRWVKIAITLFIVFVVIFVILHLLGFGMGSHGMGGHIGFIYYALMRL